MLFAQHDVSGLACVFRRAVPLSFWLARIGNTQSALTATEGAPGASKNTGDDAWLFDIEKTCRENVTRWRCRFATVYRSRAC
jgi:hypothetical protein